jgi:hypothetical protein
MVLKMNETISGQQYKPDPSVLTQRIDDGIILLNLNTNSFYKLNRTGSRFWELLCAGNAVPAIEQQILSEFDIEATELRNEIDALLADLSEKALVCHADC